MSSTMMRSEPARARAVSGSIVASFVALVVIAFGGGFLLSQGLHSSPQGLAPDSVVSLLNDNVAAINAGDSDALAATYAQDAVVTDSITGVERVGATEIAAFYAGFELKTTSEVVMQGSYASVGFEYSVNGGASYHSGVATFEIQSGKIVHQWVVGD